MKNNPSEWCMPHAVSVALCAQTLFKMKSCMSVALCTYCKWNRLTRRRRVNTFIFTLAKSRCCCDVYCVFCVVAKATVIIVIIIIINRDINDKRDAFFTTRSIDLAFRLRFFTRFNCIDFTNQFTNQYTLDCVPYWQWDREWKKMIIILDKN